MFRSPREEHAWLGQIDHLPSEISNQTKDEKPKSRKTEMQQETRRFENEFIYCHRKMSTENVIECNV